MLERFTGRARKAVVRAQEEARRLRHDHVGTGHLLLGLLGDGEGAAAEVLAAAGVGLDAARARVEELEGRAGVDTGGGVPFTPRAKTALELALREARGLDAESIDTEHLLLGLIREGGGRAVVVLTGLGADPRLLREDVLARAGAPRVQPLVPPARQSTDRRLTAIEERLARIETLLDAVADRLGRA